MAGSVVELTLPRCAQLNVLSAVDKSRLEPQLKPLSTTFAISSQLLFPNHQSIVLYGRGKIDAFSTCFFALFEFVSECSNCPSYASARKGRAAR